MDAAFRFFEQVVLMGSIRKAADHLHVSPSSVSRQIQKLEHIYGATLLVRQPQGVRLTPAGEVAMRYVQRRGRELQRLRSSIDALKNLQSGHIRMYTVEGMIGGLLPRALAQFGSRYPGITYEIYAASTDDVMRAVAEERCDLGISFQPHPRSDVDVIANLPQRLMAVVSPRHPLAQRESITLGEIGDMPVGLPDRSFGIRHLVSHVLKAEQRAFNVRMETNSIDMLRQFALYDMGLIFLPTFSFDRELATGELVGIPVSSKELPSSTIQICKRADVELTPSAQRFCEVLGDIGQRFSSVA